MPLLFFSRELAPVYFFYKYLGCDWLNRVRHKCGNKLVDCNTAQPISFNDNRKYGWQISSYKACVILWMHALPDTTGICIVICHGSSIPCIRLLRQLLNVHLRRNTTIVLACHFGNVRNSWKKLQTQCTFCYQWAGRCHNWSNRLRHVIRNSWADLYYRYRQYYFLGIQLLHCLYGKGASLAVCECDHQDKHAKPFGRSPEIHTWRLSIYHPATPPHRILSADTAKHKHTIYVKCITCPLRKRTSQSECKCIWTDWRRLFYWSNHWRTDYSKTHPTTRHFENHPIGPDHPSVITIHLRSIWSFPSGLFFIYWNWPGMPNIHCKSQPCTKNYWSDTTRESLRNLKHFNRMFRRTYFHIKYTVHFTWRATKHVRIPSYCSDDCSINYRC